MFHSSPIRQPTALEEIEETQKARGSRLYRPMSSPVAKKLGQTEENSRSSLKHKQLEDIRRMQRQLRLALAREKVVDTEDYNKQLAELKKQADLLEVDPDLLVEEEFVEEEEVDEYEEQLEDFLADEELELEQQLKDLQIQ